MAEIYSALNAGLTLLPAMGARATFDQAMSHFVGDPQGGFKGKLAAMQKLGRIDDRDTDVLQPIIDAGSAAAHRAWAPPPEILMTILHELDHKLYDWFIRDSAAAAVKEETPPRRPSR